MSAATYDQRQQVAVNSQVQLSALDAPLRMLEGNAACMGDAEFGKRIKAIRAEVDAARARAGVVAERAAGTP